MYVSRLHSPAGLPIATSFLFSLMSQMLWWASPAEAQGFFQQLFGSSTSPQVHSAPRATAPRQPIGGAPLRIQIPAETAGASRSYRDASSSYSGGKEGTGSYTTMCVRMCDGYYFPISHRVPRGRFYRDADVCRSRCDMGDARLFYHSSSGEDMKSAVDLTGRAYARLPVAFMHRKTRVAGCGCRPEPWSTEAQVRHEGYAIAEGVIVRGVVVAGGSSRGQGTLTVVAGNYSQAAAPKLGAGEAADADEASNDAAQIENNPVSQTAAAHSNEMPAQTVLQTEPQKPAAAVGGLSLAVKQKQPRRQSTAVASAPKQPVVAAAARNKPTRVASATTAGGKLVWPGDPR